MRRGSESRGWCFRSFWKGHMHWYEFNCVTILEAVFLLVNTCEHIQTVSSSCNAVLQTATSYLKKAYLEANRTVSEQHFFSPNPNEAFPLAVVYLSVSDAMKCNDWTKSTQGAVGWPAFVSLRKSQRLCSDTFTARQVSMDKLFTLIRLGQI